MGTVYKGQTAIKYTTSALVDITGATAKLKYFKPDGTAGEFTAGVNITNAATGTFEWMPADENDLDQVGTWTFWAYVTFSNGKVAAGEPFQETIKEEGIIC